MAQVALVPPRKGDLSQGWPGRGVLADCRQCNQLRLDAAEFTVQEGKRPGCAGKLIGMDDDALAAVGQWGGRVRRNGGRGHLRLLDAADRNQQGKQRTEQYLVVHASHRMRC